MIISLLGYMGSGKSHISRTLSKQLNYEFIDLDECISKHFDLKVDQIFHKHGELAFRKAEKEILEDLLKNSQNTILSLGGGTAVYYNNMETINQYSQSIFLLTSIPTLVSRLEKEQQKRPIIAKIPKEGLAEFIAKHLFERNPYYQKATHTIATDTKNDTEICHEIISRLGL